MNAQSIAVKFKDIGFYSPVKIFEKEKCKKILKQIKGESRQFEWNKGKAICSSIYYDIARDEKIVGILSEIIGNDILLWGANLITKKRGQVHPWHTDIETSSCMPGKTVSVWIGLKNCKKSSLNLISYSHKFDKCFQQTAFDKGRKRGESTNVEVIKWAKEKNSSSALYQTSVEEGDAIFFDGRLWHSSFNNNFFKSRTAVILQYASVGTEIRQLNPENLEWPFTNQRQPLAPCLLIKGNDNYKINRVYDAPSRDNKNHGREQYLNQKSRFPSIVKNLDLPLKENKETGWQPYHIFRGSTKSINHITNHISVLSPGKSPHSPHQHIDEELLIMISGEADLILSEKHERIRLKSGQFAYYPSYYPHTIDNTSSEPATYMMFKWRNNRQIMEMNFLRESIFEYVQLFSENNTNQTSSKSFTKIFEGQTQFLQKLHCHVTTLKPKAGYPPHKDWYDVAIILFEGQIETLGKIVNPLSVIFYPKDQAHGIKNVGNSDAFYLVFEFHGNASFPSLNRILKILKRRYMKYIYSITR